MAKIIGHGDAHKSMYLVLIKVSTNFASGLEKTKIMRNNKVQRRFKLLCKGNCTVESTHQDNATTTTAIGHQHCRRNMLNNGGEMKIGK